MLLTDLPMYLYYNNELPSRGDGTLFHFTSWKNFQLIMNDLSLLPSSFGNLNDLNEANVNNMNMTENFMVMYDAEKYIKERCHLLCFSQNYEINGIGQEGSNHPAMWAHYAENSDGVCIVIDKEKFIKTNRQILDTHCYQFGGVSYSIINTLDDEEIDYKVETPEEFIKNNWEGLFFLKHKDWENEDEHRLLIMDYEGKFRIDGCIKYIVLGRKVFLDNTKMKSIIDMVVDPSHPCYHRFIPHSFATVSYNTSGYFTHEISGHIMQIVMANSDNELYAEYRRWLNDEMGIICNLKMDPILTIP